MEAFDQSQSGWTRDHGNIFPLLISLQDFAWRCIKLFFHPAVLFNPPHASV